jgi:hypothetical protein
MRKTLLLTTAFWAVYAATVHSAYATTNCSCSLTYAATGDFIDRNEGGGNFEVVLGISAMNEGSQTSSESGSVQWTFHCNYSGFSNNPPTASGYASTGLDIGGTAQVESNYATGSANATATVDSETAYSSVTGVNSQNHEALLGITSNLYGSSLSFEPNGTNIWEATDQFYTSSVYCSINVVVPSPHTAGGAIADAGILTEGSGGILGNSIMVKTN